MRAITLDLYTFVVLLLALLIAGVLIGVVGSPWWERRTLRRLQLRRLRQR